MSERKDWFEWYVAQLNKEKSRPKFRDRFLCPCCFMPTLHEKADFEICPICFWEDDGQDSEDAYIVRGGPNKNYSLKEARENFKQNHTMYRDSDENPFKSEMRRMPLKKKMYQAFSQALESNSESDWKGALMIEKEYYDR